MIDYKYQLQRLINKVNRVTSAHRHGQSVSSKDLDALSNRQIDVEAVIQTHKDFDGDGNYLPMADPKDWEFEKGEVTISRDTGE